MNESDFLNRLYSIKPFKMVESPESVKKNSGASIEPEDLASSIEFKMESCPSLYTPPKQGLGSQEIIETEMFSSLTSSIDNLFSKIEKIKSEFSCPVSSSSKKKTEKYPSTMKKKSLKKNTDKEN